MLDQTVVFIIQFGMLATAVLAIWALQSRFNRSFEEKIKKTVDPMIKKSEDNMIKLMEEKDSSSNKDVLHELKALSARFEEYAAKQNKYNEIDVKRFRILEQGLVEAYKKQIRNVYYSARDNGVIRDSEMAYIQKIYPYYKAMGGNSDVKAKVDELNKVYSEVLQEKFKEAREKCKENTEDNLAAKRLKRIKDKEGE